MYPLPHSTAPPPLTPTVHVLTSDGERALCAVVPTGAPIKWMAEASVAPTSDPEIEMPNTLPTWLSKGRGALDLCMYDDDTGIELKDMEPVFALQVDDPALEGGEVTVDLWLPSEEAIRTLPSA